MFLKWMAIPVLAVCAQAEVVSKPPCNRQNRGRLWPEQKSARACRAIEICTLHVWKYRWEPLTVHVSQLAKDPKRRAACEEAVSPPAAERGGAGESTARER